MSKYHLDYLEQLEAESIHIFREIAASSKDRRCYSAEGKDSITLVHLAQKAFAPGRFLFRWCILTWSPIFPKPSSSGSSNNELGATLVVRKVEDTIKESLTRTQGRISQSQLAANLYLADTIEEFKFDACIGGARRDEEKARAKEEFFR